MQPFAQILDQAGGSGAPPEQAARLRSALEAEEARGAEELTRARSGYDAPPTVAFPADSAVLPVPAALRADPGAASDRAWLLTAAAVGALVEAGGAEVRAGEWQGFLVLVSAGAEAELAAVAFEEQVHGIDRLRAAAAHTPP